MWNIKVMVIPTVISAYKSIQRFGKGPGIVGNRWTSGEHSNYCILEIDTEKNLGDLRRLAVTQT